MTANALTALPFATVLVALSVLAARARPGRVLPLVAHNLVWAAAYLVVGSELIHYSPISIRAWFVLVSGAVAFNVGYLLFTRPRRGADETVAGSSDESGPPDIALVGRRGLLALLVAYSLGFGLYVVTIMRHFGLMTLLLNPTAVRGAADGYLALVPAWARVLLFLGPLVFALVAVRPAVRNSLPLAWRVLLLAYLAASMLALLQRTNLFLALLWTISVFLFTARTQSADSDTDLAALRRARIRRRVFAVGAVAIALGGFAGFQVVAGALGKDGGQAVSSGAVSEALAGTGLTSVVTYATGGIPAFSQLVESDNHEWPDPARLASPGLHTGDYNPQTWGGATFEPFVRIIPIVRPWESIAAFVEIPFYFNVYTWYETLYRDFRSAGVIVGMLALGAAAAATYVRRFRSVTAYWVGSYLVALIFLCTFVSRFFHSIYFISLVLALGLGLLADRRRTRSRRAPSPGADLGDRPSLTGATP
ncbi:oligosaccharide repeat unit polymerase [Sanguibacter sp. HDW7]|uniref:oligosaccharide repeat unit polymerase n=1 Tax=Sanguibacter sp. HDW7 TaxID=2714931 RepID=UPI00140E8B18|nr:oligosaccharide repeat unit polymerase [Sanguibacter sp. HDW7]QIK84267.1 oligosaccharide repeat unit polymerase [Sanguibacter sp. HDW7]